MNKKYQLVNYFDVWGNANEGFEVNDQCRENIFMEINDDTTEEDIINFLIEEGFLTGEANIENIEVEWNTKEFIELFERDNMFPLCALELVNN